MATVTKLKAAVNNMNLPILGEDGNIYSYYFGRYFNKIVEKGYTPTSGEITALNAFIQDGINNGWIDIVKYFLPLIGDSSNLAAAAVPLIDEVGNYEMAEYDGTEDFTNSFEVDQESGKIKYYTKIGTGGDPLKSPFTHIMMHYGISFSGYMAAPVVYDDADTHSDYFASIKKDELNRVMLGIRYHEISISKNHQAMYLADPSDSDVSMYNLNIPNKQKIEELSASGTPLLVNFSIYKLNGEVKRLRSYLDGDGGWNFVNGNPDKAFSYPDYETNTNKMFFSGRNLKPVNQKFGCLGVLDAPQVTQNLAISYNNAVFTLMTALGK